MVNWQFLLSCCFSCQMASSPVNSVHLLKRCDDNDGDDGSQSTNKNGIRWSKGMTTTAGGLRDEMSMCDVRKALTQTTQV